MNKKTTISGFTVELELYTESGESRSDCTVTKGRYYGSLELLSGCGYLNDSQDNELDVPASVIDRIVHWAEVNGY